MKLSKLLLACAMLVGVAAVSVPAQATLCPNTAFATDCNLFITFNADGSITTTNGSQTNYDGVEDASIGVINNTGHTITSFSISAPGIFGFDGDGICVFMAIGACAGNTMDGSGYGGPNAFFTNSDLDNGAVHFIVPIAANGGTDFFSLEESININQPPVIGAPEPTTMALLGIALLGAGIARRRKS